MPKKKKIEWQDRILETGRKAASEFNYNPGNFRLHSDAQRGTINAVLSEVGWVTGVIENKRTGNLIDGHLRIEEALKTGSETLVPYTLVDLSEDEEKKVLMVFDQIGNLASIDADAFAALAEAITFESDELLALTREIAGENLDDLNDEPNLNDPNFNYQNQFGVIVECEDEAHQKRVFDELQAVGHKVKVVVV